MNIEYNLQFAILSSGVAQLVERSTSMRKVAGSIPGGGKKNISEYFWAALF